LDVVRPERDRGLEEKPPHPVGLDTALVAGVEEPVHQELELEMAEPVVVEDTFQVAEALRLEQVLEIGVPDPEPAEADLARRRAALVPAEEAPLASDVDLDRAGDRPVEADELDGH